MNLLKSWATLLGVMSLLYTGPLFGQVSIGIDSVVLIDFDSSLAGVNFGPYAGKGLVKDPDSPDDLGRLDSRAWRLEKFKNNNVLDFGQQKTNAQVARGLRSGGENNSGGLFALNINGNRAFAIQPSGNSFTPGYIYLRLINDGTSIIEDIRLTYDILAYNDQNRSNKIWFGYSLDGDNYTLDWDNFFYSPTTKDADPSWETTPVAFDMEDLNINPGDTIYFRFSTRDYSGSGNRDELAIDNIRIATDLFVERRHFQSRASGDWTDPDTWEWGPSPSGPFVAADEYPTYSNSDYVRIDDDTVVVDYNLEIDQLLIDDLGYLCVDTLVALTIMNEDGVDLQVDGTLEDNSKGSAFGIEFSTNGKATWAFGANGTFIKTGNSKLYTLRDHYEGGVSAANMPDGATWIYRLIKNADDLQFIANGMVYPNLRFENLSGRAFTPSSNSEMFSGSTESLIIDGDVWIDDSVSVYFLAASTSITNYQFTLLDGGGGGGGEVVIVGSDGSEECSGSVTGVGDDDDGGQSCNADTASFNGYRFVFNGVVNNSDGTSTWSYTVEAQGSAPHDLSHWVLALDENHNVTSVSSGQEVGTDPTTGVYGIKFDREISKSFGTSKSFSFTLDNVYFCEDVQVAFKASRDKFYSTLRGPSATVDEDAELEAEACVGDPSEKVSPVLEYYDPDTDELVWGYYNRNDCIVNIPIGAKNKFTGLTGQDGGQPEYFQPGRCYGCFRTPATNGNVVWTLKSPNGKTSTATGNRDSQRPSDDGDDDDDDEASCVAKEDLPGSLLSYMSENFPDKDFTACLYELCDSTEGYLVTVEGEDCEEPDIDDGIDLSQVCDDPSEKVSPVLEYYNPNTDELVWGYYNRNDCIVNIPIGAKNKFTGLSGQDEGQPEYFQPGRCYGCFKTSATNGNVVWTLKSPNGQGATSTGNRGSQTPSGDVDDEEEDCDPEGEKLFFDLDGQIGRSYEEVERADLPAAVSSSFDALIADYDNYIIEEIINIEPANPGPTIINGNITIGKGSFLTNDTMSIGMDADFGTGIQFAGDSIVVNGSIDFTKGSLNHGKLILTGGGDQVIYGLQDSAVIKQLLINKASGKVILNRSITVTDTLNLGVRPVVVTGGNTLTLDTSIAIIRSGPEALIVLEPDEAIVNVTVEKSQTFEVPLSSSDYFPYENKLTIINGNNPELSFNLRLYNTVLSKGMNGTPIHSKVVPVSWGVERTSEQMNLPVRMSFVFVGGQAAADFKFSDTYVSSYDEDLGIWLPLNNPPEYFIYGGPSSTYALSPDDPLFFLKSENTLFAIGSAAALPIELMSFDAKAVPEGAELFWATASETNNDFFAIERAGEDLVFSEIGRLPGAGTTVLSQEYIYIDERPLAGINYYRLRQVDFDGELSYSAVRSLTFENEALSFRAYPNPARDRLFLRWTSPVSGDGFVRIFHSSGELVYQDRLNEGSTAYEANLNRLPVGVYVVDLNGQKIRVVKQ